MQKLINQKINNFRAYSRMNIKGHQERTFIYSLLV